MGNYYEGKLCFGIKENIPKDVLHDLLLLSNNSFLQENFAVLQNTKWGNHERYDYPSYNIQLKKYGKYAFYLFEIDFCMKGYCINGDDLGEDIYEFLKQYIDEYVYDMSDGGYIGRITDEDETYDKSFYVNYDKFNSKKEERKHLCNDNCRYYEEDVLCDKYNICDRAYQLGKKQKG